MSDVFYLNVPRIRMPRGASSEVPRAAALRLQEALPQVTRVATPDGGWGVLPMAVGIVAVGCVLSAAVRFWQYQRRCGSALTPGGVCVPWMGRGQQLQRRRLPLWRHRRLVQSADMGGNPAAPKEAVGPGREKAPQPAVGHSPGASRIGGDDGDNRDGVELPRSAHYAEMADAHCDALASSSQDSSLIFITTTGEQYKRVSQLGRGGFGSVYKCFNLTTGEVVVVKEVRLAEHSDKNSNSSSAEELRCEFELLSRVTHPHIIRVIGYHVGRRHARLFLEWAAGGSLMDVVKGVGASFASGVPEDLVHSYVRQMLEALQCLHEHGIIHRDIKPQNMLIDHAGRLRVTDFGLSRLIGEGASAVETTVAGTPRYMAPETISGARFSCGSDLWALGAVMSELFTGRPPWSHLETHQLPALLYRIANHPEEHPVIPAHISAEAKDFMAQCFRPEPADRGTAASLLQHPFLTRERRGQRTAGE
ncbi:protein kinase [Trypanosoma rangeli]|uniref:Protein kinase n=1 Tax=Trypanosoma rangeli TaxID=5698 RepID=A0A3R7KRP1_TRYRA|nr:protein kinase [Trypanosoma rangeli]RNE99991.1 protein kinase [Trypanosoma rangeli]|eukprot:RNE99991.1 protein kinase [Trypanosoma rangeli]